MKRIESIEDQMMHVVTYQLSDGRRVRLDADAVAQYGAAAALQRAGFGDALPTERLPVMQDGRRIGTLPPDFDPSFVKCGSWLYDPRPGDFRREGDVWIASRMLGPGDLEAVVGFARET